MWVCHDSFLCATQLFHMCAMLYWMSRYVCVTTHSCVRHNSVICALWFIPVCDTTHSHVWHDSFIYVTRLLHMCDTTHSYVWHDSFICVTRLFRMCVMTHYYVWNNLYLYGWHDSFIFATWLIHICDMTHSYLWHDSFIFVIRQENRTPLMWFASSCQKGGVKALLDANAKVCKYANICICITYIHTLGCCLHLHVKKGESTH